jgi:imidazole glycerol-phosphate synthase subunit HisH
VKVVLADYGAGNVRSVSAAFERAGADVLLTRDPEVVVAADLAVVSGVGHVASAAIGLRKSGLDEALRRRITGARAVLGICVGMQILFGESEEGGSGLGILAGRVRRLRARRVPHMGWNSLRVVNGSEVVRGLAGADVYFAHSYSCEPADPAVVAAETDHDETVVAAVEHGALAGVQFHPERSGAAGALLLRNAIEWSRSV